MGVDGAAGRTPTVGSIGVVLPVRNDASYLPEWIDAVVPQAAALGAAIVVVDDASDDQTRDLAQRAGLTIIAQSRSSGPYVARNVGWLSHETDAVVFLDVRCRPRPGALAAMVDALDDPDVVIAGAEIVTSGGKGPAARWAAVAQPMNLRWQLLDPFLPFVPTAALAIRRRDLVALGGFSPVRSAGDADLCWRAQLGGLGAVVAASGAVFDAVPRTSRRAVIAQASRFGTANARLWARFSAAGHDLPAPPTLLRRARLALAIGRNTLRQHRDPALGWLQVRRHWAYESAYRRSYRAVTSGGSSWPEPSG